MITKNNPSAQASLFKRAEEVLSKYGSQYAGQSILNIDDYFSILRELATLENNNAEIDPIFTILPVTEETFKIDANTRQIEVPENFSKYGVGVQGDEIAEIIYFSIDRYFDAIDLAEKEILIQWRHEKDAQGVQNLSATYKRSLTLQPGKIVFGWPISREVTERPGNVLFSVRFYEREGEGDNAELIYSFSTATSQIKIQSGLNFELSPSITETAIKKNDQIYKNLRNSQQAGLEYTIAMPNFTGYYYYTITADGTKEPEAIESPDRRHDLPVQFVVKAVIPENDNGEISSKGLRYEWYYALDKNANESRISKNEGTESIEYILVDTNNEKYNPKEFYYYNTGTDENPDWEVYHITEDDNPFDDVDAQGNKVKLYVQRSTCIPAKAGYFIAKAINNYSLGKYAEKESEYWLVPFANEPTYTYTPANRDLILENGEGTITVEASINDGGELSYQWYYSTTDDWNNAIMQDGETSNIITVNKEGFYFLKATNKKNNSESKNHSLAITTAYAPSTPVISKYKVDGQTIESVNETGIVVSGLKELSITINEDFLVHKDIISYQWKKASGDTLIPIPGATNSNYIPNGSGSYKCTVTNTYKGHSVSETSYTFGVIA